MKGVQFLAIVTVWMKLDIQSDAGKSFTRLAAYPWQRESVARTMEMNT
jgi:hypothetical protein